LIAFGSGEQFDFDSGGFMRISTLVIFLILASSAALFSQENSDLFQIQRLPLGDGEERFDLVRVPLYGFFSGRSNELTTSEKAFREFSTARIILVGEGHTTEQHHQLQLKIIRGLVERSQKVVVALEMFNPLQNAALADFSAGRTTESEFLKQADWVNVWGHDFRYYQPIFQFARQFKLPIAGINLPHQLVSKVAMGGMASLSEEELKGAPVPEISNPQHRFLVNSMMQGVGALSPEIFANMYVSQCLWDAGMGEGAIRAAKEFPDHVVVVLAGTGHVAYGLGTARVIRARSSLPVLTVIPVDIPISDKARKNGSKQAFMVHLGEHGGDAAYPHEVVSRTLADFMVGVPAEKHEKYPTLGLSLKTGKNGELSVARVMPDSLAEKAGLSRGDLVLKANGRSFKDATEFKVFMGELNWGDSVRMTVRKEKATRNVIIKLQPAN